MLLVSRNDVFDIQVNYLENEEALSFYEPDGDPMPDGIKTVKFIFRKPNWTDTKTISSAACQIDPFNGKTIIDPFKYMDQKFKTLLKDWTLFDEDGISKLPITYNNIDLLRPELVQYVFSKVEEKLNGTVITPLDIPKVDPKVIEG